MNLTDRPTGDVRNVPLCYNMHMTRRGIAYQLWAAIEAERVRRGWTQVEMAQQIGRPRSTIDRLKDGMRAPQPRTVHAIADALGWDRDDTARLAGLLPQQVHHGEHDQSYVDPVTGEEYIDHDERTLWALSSERWPEEMRRRLIYTLRSEREMSARADRRAS